MFGTDEDRALSALSALSALTQKGDESTKHYWELQRLCHALPCQIYQVAADCWSTVTLPDRSATSRRGTALLWMHVTTASTQADQLNSDRWRPCTLQTRSKPMDFRKFRPWLIPSASKKAVSKWWTSPASLPSKSSERPPGFNVNKLGRKMSEVSRLFAGV